MLTNISFKKLGTKLNVALKKIQICSCDLCERKMLTKASICSLTFTIPLH